MTDRQKVLQLVCDADRRTRVLTVLSLYSIDLAADLVPTIEDMQKIYEEAPIS